MRDSLLADRLSGPCAALGIELQSRALETLRRYLDLLLPWNERVNLTGARSREEVVDRHLADALPVVALVAPGARRFADVGAGAGFLGVVVATLRPDVRCVLLEPAGKKLTFLRAVARDVGLSNLEPRGERLEEHLAPASFSPYDVAASRATWPPLEWLERARPLLQPGGVAVGFEGRRRLALPADVERRTYRVGRRDGALLLRWVR
jgi:16S rRNA (guanine527-N7)-methyltransferase